MHSCSWPIRSCAVLQLDEDQLLELRKTRIARMVLGLPEVVDDKAEDTDQGKQAGKHSPQHRITTPHRCTTRYHHQRGSSRSLCYFRILSIEYHSRRTWRSPYVRVNHKM